MHSTRTDACPAGDGKRGGKEKDTMHWTESRFWRTIALLAVVGLFTLALSIGGDHRTTFVQPAQAKDILVIPEASGPRFQVMTTADNGTTLIWWYFKKDNPQSIELTDTKVFRSSR
jgi:hypothetical protein